MKPQRSVGTVLFTDIVGSTECATELGDRAWHALLERHHACVRDELHRFGGHEVATAGDGFLALFDEPGEAMACAWAVRDAVRELGVEVRCGVHMGAVDHANGNVGGIGVHIAARVLGEADAGEILVSQTVHDAEAGSGFVFEDRGTRSLKGLSGEWRLFALEGIPDRVSTGPLAAWFDRHADRRGFLVGAAAALVVLLLLAGVYGRSGDESAVADGPSSLESPAVTHRQVTFVGTVLKWDASPDGKTIAYSSLSQGKTVLYVRDLAGGEPLELGRYNHVRRIRWSPTGENLLVTVLRPEPAVLLFPRLGGSPRELPYAGPRGEWRLFAWSPDGGQFVSVSISAERLWFRDISTGDSTAIALPDSFTWLFDIDWSPRGDRIAFATFEGPSLYTIWTIGTKGEAAQKIVQDAHEEILSFRWSKAGDGIYFLRTHEDAAELVRVDVPPRIGEPPSSPAVLLSGIGAGFSTNWRPLASEGDFDVFEEDGRVLYARYESFSNLWLVEPRPSGDSEMTQLTSGTAGKWNPSVSPDGQKIAFQLSTGSVSNIYVLPLEGGAMKQITYLQNASCPAWSPDGSEIVFKSEEEGKARVWKIAADGGTPHSYPDTDVTAAGMCLSWAPGDQILYQRPGNRNFYLLDADTGEEKPLVSNENVGRMYTPRYSPDGTKVAVYWARRAWADAGLWIISLSDGAQERIGEGGFPLGWSPDGEWLYGLKSISNESLQVVRYSMADHSSVVVATIECGKGLLLPSLIMTPDTRRFVCVAEEQHSDLWMAEPVNLAGGVDR